MQVLTKAVHTQQVTAIDELLYLYQILVNFYIQVQIKHILIHKCLLFLTDI